jgi:predicted PurR-regulated permease PerM
MSRTKTPFNDAASVEQTEARPPAVVWMLIVCTGLLIYLCYLVISPFLPALAWALALAVLAHPIHKWLRRRWAYPNLCAGTVVVVVVLLIMAPVAFVTQSLISEASLYLRLGQEQIASGEWKETINRHPAVRRIVSWIDPSLELSPRRTGENAPTDDSAEPFVDESSNSADETSKSRKANSAAGGPSMAGAAGVLTRGATSIVTGTIEIGMQILITVMCLFYFLRDRHDALKAMRSLLPLTNSEVDEIFGRVDDTIHATVFGSLTVALVQGFMGGLMFWLLGLASPLFWGAIMGLLAVVPVLGTFVIWAPTAASLAIHGEWGKAIILASWGAVAIGLIDNLLYPWLVGNRMRFHTLLVFFSMVGGLAQFGASGIILGPLLLAIADAMLEIWRRRTGDHRSVEIAVSPAVNP